MPIGDSALICGEDSSCQSMIDGVSQHVQKQFPSDMLPQASVKVGHELSEMLLVSKVRF